MKSEPRFWLTGDIYLDVVTQKAYHNQSEVKLSDLSFKVLQVLVEAFPKPVSHDQLMDQVWQQAAVSPETVTQRIALIRKAFNDVGVDAKEYIAVARSVGYRWLQPVDQTDSINGNKVQRAMLLVLVVMIVCILILWNKPDSSSKKINTSAAVSAKDLTQRAWSYLDRHNPQSNELAIGLFRQALAADSADVHALTGLSIALSHQVTKFNQAGSLLIEARKLAQAATELEPTHAKAWAALAFVDDANGDIDAAIRGYEKVIELDAENTSTISSLAYLYGLKGRLVDAMRLNVSVLGSKQRYLDLQIAQALALLGFDVLAEQWFYKADVLAPDNVFVTHARARYYLSRNQPNKAIEIIKQAQSRGISRPELPNLLGLVAWKNGDLSLANTYFVAASDIDPNDMQSMILKQTLHPHAKVENESSLLAVYSWPDQSVYQAQYYAKVGQIDEAFMALSRSFELGFRDHAWLQWLPAFDVLKADQRWAELMMQIQHDVGQQRQRILNAEWLPTSFLDPKN